LQRSGSIFRPAEKELTERLQELLEKEGITIILNAKVKRVEKQDDKKAVVYETAQGEQRVIADEILLAGGKTPNTKELALDKTGVTINEKQAITVTQSFQTSKHHIYAVGDVINLPLRLETTAGKEGTLATENALTGMQKTIDYTSVPYTIFTDPQLSSVGLTEDEQMEKLGVCACRTVSFLQVPKGIIIGRTEGVIKMVIHPDTHQIMGVHILAPHASDLIAEAMILAKNKVTIEEVLDTLPVFPSLSEAIKIVAMSFTRDISKLSCCT
jgi:mercuric reductase